MKVGDKVKLLGSGGYLGDSFVYGNTGIIKGTDGVLDDKIYEVEVKCLGEDDPKFINRDTWPFYEYEIQVIEND